MSGQVIFRLAIDDQSSATLCLASVDKAAPSASCNLILHADETWIFSERAADAKSTLDARRPGAPHDLKCRHAEALGQSRPPQGDSVLAPQRLRSARIGASYQAILREIGEMMTRISAVVVMFSIILTPLAGFAAEVPLTTGTVNRGVVELETMGTGDVSPRIGEDLASLIDDGATRRVLPIIGKGSLQNIIDLKALHGVDMAILQVDVLDYARQQNLFPGIESSFTYITKLYNQEFHLLARRGINTVADLANQKINVDVAGAGTGVTARRLFELLGVPVSLTNDDQGTAIEELRKGEIAAVAFVAGKPAPLFLRLDGKEGLHLLSIPLNPTITAAFVPTRLTAEDYPGLIPADSPISTVAVGTVLAVANLPILSDRYRNVATFVDAFFTRFQSLSEPGHHPKWREVNLFAELPGWVRYPPAAQWLQRNAPVASAAGPQGDMKAIFSRFINDRQQATGGPPLTEEQKEDLFNQFQRWQSGRDH
jgi:TRAP-type uncharacterized transport system substrate-binding protein